MIEQPIPPKHPIEIVQHGQIRKDNYAWIRDKNWAKFIYGELEFDNPEVLDYLEAENSYKNEMMASSNDLQKKLYDEILGRIKEDDQTYPYQINDYSYFQRTEKGQNYPILCRKKGSPDSNGPEEIYFDVNKEAKNHKLFIMGAYKPSPNNKYLAYSYNTTGSMERTLRVRDLSTGKDLGFEIPETTGYGLLWLDNQTLLYVDRGESTRGQKVIKLDIHKGIKEQQVIFDKPAEFDDMFISLYRSTDKKFIYISLASGSRMRLYFKALNDEKFELFSVGENDIRYEVDHYDGRFFVLTNDGGSNDFKIMTCQIGDCAKDKWHDFVLESKGLYIENFAIYGGKLLLNIKNNSKALSEIKIIDIKTKDSKTVKMSESVYSLDFIGADNPNSTLIRYLYQSPKQPKQYIDIDLRLGEYYVRKTDDVPHFNSSLYEVKREYAISHDGLEIPLTIVHKKNQSLDGSALAFVYGYGSYGHGMSPNFTPTIFSLVDRGFVYVIAHIRGGNDKGFNWYLDGKMRKKKNTFHDYISSCQYLIDKKYTSKGKIVANGGSAGGLLMGAVVNMRPDLFKSVVADVPFVDVVNTISDASLPLTPPEWEEWGNPITNKEDFEYILSYSPYENVRSQNYPAMLFNSGISDEQVTYWEPAKMVAKLRELKRDDNILLLNIKMHAGHAGASKRYEWIKDKAFAYAFILNNSR